MSENSSYTYSTKIVREKSPWFHLALFLVTFVTTTFAGVEWTTGTMGPHQVSDLMSGLPYALSLLFFLTCHEFGHYFAAKYHGVKTTLPYYIPFPPIMGFFNFGTMGAVIRIKDKIHSNKAMFDIGVAGPIAGFIAAILILIYGFISLPSVDYILSIHPDFFSEEYGSSGIVLEFGDSILFSLFRMLFTNPGDFVPPMTEIYHYPYLCVGWFGLFVTAMNMIPIGQLDGGHIVYGMFGLKKHENIAGLSMIVLLVLGAMGLIDMILGLNMGIGWTGWLFWAFILFFIIKIKHPPVYHFSPLDNNRKILGYFSLLILVLSFSPSPFVVYMF